MAKIARARIAASSPTPIADHDAKMISRPNVGIALPHVADVHGEEAAAAEVPEDHPDRKGDDEGEEQGDR